MGRRGRSQLRHHSRSFVTTTVVNFAKVFTGAKYCDILVSNIKYYQEKYKFDINGYVIMPSHFHWIVKVNPHLGNISSVMRDIKKYSAWDVMDALEKDGRNDLLMLFKEAAVGAKDQERKLWMRRFDDEMIRNEKMLEVKLNYIHNNPVVAGLVKNPEDYRYSSARNFVLDDDSVLRIQKNWLD